jgi:hypothetical protein
LALPVWWLLQREAAKPSDPRYLREQGVVIVSERVLQAQYRFEKLVDPAHTK